MRKIENPEAFRNNIRIKLQEMLDSEKKAINLEKGIYNYAVKEATNRKVVRSGIIHIIHKYIWIGCEVFISIWAIWFFSIM